jgi:hypothetical protein
MKTLRIKLSKLKANKNNPRVIKDDQYKKLVNSLRDFPEMLDIRPIVVNKDYEILGGNMRFRALQELKIKEVDVLVVDLDENKQQEFIIKDNIAHGEWDWDVLANEFDKDALNEWGLSIFYNVDDLNHKSEWENLPDFDSVDSYYKLVINFDSKEELEQYVKKNNIRLQIRNEKTYSTHEPFKDKEDKSSLKYVEA